MKQCYATFLSSRNERGRSSQVKGAIEGFSNAVAQSFSVEPIGPILSLQEIGRSCGGRWYRMSKETALLEIATMGDGKPDVMAAVPITKRPGAVHTPSFAQLPNTPMERDARKFAMCGRHVSLDTGPEVGSDFIFFFCFIGYWRCWVDLGCVCVRQRYGDVRLLDIKGHL